MSLSINWLRPLPDAVILGAMRSGTTFLHAALQRHDGIAPTKLKELHYFTLYWELGREAYRDQMPIRWPKWMYQISGRKRRIALDSTPYYLFHPDAPGRLSSTLGAPKCVVLLREPATRAWSHYNHMLSLGCEYLGFSEALDREEERTQFLPACTELNPHATGHMLFSYAARGFYADQLKRWWRHVPRQQFLLLRSEDLFTNPQSCFDKVCDFLGMERAILPSGLPQNARSAHPLPLSVRERLDALYERPNQELFDLTGIRWQPSIPRETAQVSACLQS